MANIDDELVQVARNTAGLHDSTLRFLSVVKHDIPPFVMTRGAALYRSRAAVAIGFGR